MATSRRALPHDDDVVLYAASTREAIHSAVLQLNELAKTKVAANDATVTDAETGEIRPRVWRFTFGEDRASLTEKQRGFLHAAVFPQMAEQIRVPIYADGVLVDSVRYVAKTWKEHCRETFLGDHWVRTPLPGQFTPKGKQKFKRRKERVSTEDLSSKQYSEYIDRCIAYATTDFGVAFVFDEQERESVRYKRPPRKAKQPQGLAT